TLKKLKKPPVIKTTRQVSGAAPPAHPNDNSFPLFPISMAFLASNPARQLLSPNPNLWNNTMVIRTPPIQKQKLPAFERPGTRSTTSQETASSSELKPHLGNSLKAHASPSSPKPPNMNLEHALNTAQTSLQ